MHALDITSALSTVPGLWLLQPCTSSSGHTPASRFLLSGTLFYDVRFTEVYNLYK